MYWERQDTNAAHCAVHAINNILQKEAADAAALHGIAAALDTEEAALLYNEAHPRPVGNARPHGDFTVQVIQRFLRKQDAGWIVTDTRNPRVRDSINSDPRNEIGYLTNNGGTLGSLTAHTGGRGKLLV